MPKSTVKDSEKLERTTDNIDEVDEVIENEELDDQQKLFCLIYVKCFSPRKAYQRSFGCADAKEADRLGRNMLNRKAVKAEIKELKKLRFAKAFLDEEDVLQKHIDIAFADITDIVEFGYSGDNDNPNVIRLKDSANIDGSVVAEIRFSKTSTDIRMVDKQKSLVWLSDHFGQMDEEKKARLAKLQEEVKAISGRENVEGGIIQIPAVIPTRGDARNGQNKEI